MPHSKLIVSGNTIEYYNYEREINKKIQSGIRKAFKRRNTTPLYSRSDSIRRRYKSFSRLVRANLVGSSEPSLLTLTIAQNVGIKRGYEYLAEFWRQLRQSSVKVERFIAVPEFQKRGSVHFHIIIWGINDYVEKERDSRKLQHLWQRGFVDCLRTDGSEKLAGYLAKYMRKSMYDRRLVGQKAYSASRSCLRSVSLSSSQAFNYSLEAFGYDLSTLIPLQDRSFDTRWLGRCRYRLYKPNS